MESFLPSEIARLVLGYLEDQKCEEAYNTFLKTSLHLEECLKMKEDGRKFRTQVLGLSLLDILYEYSAIYSLVQERLKKVDPEAVERLRHSGTLLDKITFLLNSTSSGQTMLFSISLPPGNSPQTSTVAHAHVRKRLRTSSSHDKRKDISRKNIKPNENEISIIESSSNVHHNLETTNLSSLPGNSIQNLNQTGQENDNIIRTPKRKTQGSNNKRQSRANSVVPEELEDNFDITALTQALLDNHELHEKIAENINKVICTPEINTNVSVGVDACSAQNLTPDTNTSVQNTNNFTMELDNVIKKIVHDTESDPIFENFLHEVVGPSGQEETSDDYDDRGISNTSTPSKSGSDTSKKQIKNRNRSAKQKRANSPENTTNTIDDHNAVAIESIISINAPESEKTCTVPTIEVIKNIENITTTVDTIIPTATNIAASLSETTTTNVNPSVSVTLPMTPASNQNLTVDTNVPTNITTIDQNILGNQNKNILMVGQQPQQPPPTFVIADSFPSLYQQPTILPDNRIIFLSNKTPTIGSQCFTMPSTYQISQPATVITDNDILNMPTVFISDDPKTSSGYIISHPSRSKRPKTTRKPSNKPKPRLSPRKIIQKKDTQNNDLDSSTTTTQETETVKYTISIQAEPKQATDTSEELAPGTSGLSGSTEKDTLTEKNVTPEKVKSTSSSKLQLSLSSPRSTKSHIRALDFSTPTKENHSPRKASTSPKSQQNDKLHEVRKSSSKAMRKLSTALFVSPVKSTKVPIATKSPKVKLKGDWNEDLIVGNKKSDNDKNKKASKLRRSGSENGLDCDKLVEGSEHNYRLCDCQSKPVGKKLKSWDQELRSLIVPVPPTPQPKKTPAKKRTRTSQRNKEKKDKKDKKENANTTETEVMCIEAELAKMEGSGEPEKPLTEEAINEVKEKETVAEESESKATKAQPEKKRKHNNNKSKSVVQKVELNIREETTLSTPEKSKDAEKSEDTNTSSQDLNKSIPTESLRNMTPKIRKKCNTSSSSKKTPTNPDESKQKLPENETNSQTIEVKEMTILSPSKMDKNASKRSLIEQSVKDGSQTENDLLAPPKEANKSLSSIITPNMLKASCSNEITAKRNLIPVLETPMKEDSLLLPITPRLFTPFNLDSPLTRILGEKMDTGDLAPFLSPSFPMTPSFPITPNLQSGDTQSSYASRPTDYSNSSSYYQPSDSEQNQKLEQVLIDEAMKIETSDLKSKYIKTSTPCKTSDSSEATEVADAAAKIRSSSHSLEQSNSNKKTLNLSQSSLDSSTASSSSNTSSSSSSSDDSKENMNKDEGNITVIHAVSDKETIKTQTTDKILNKLTPNRELCIRLIKSPDLQKQVSPVVEINKSPKGPIKRSRGRPKSPLKRTNDKINKATTSTVSKRPPGRPRKVNNTKPVKEDGDEDVTEKHREIKSNVTGSHAMLLKELEEKRKRIITGLKTTKPGRPKKKLTKDIIKNNIKGSLRVTRASANKVESNESQETKKTVPDKLKDKVQEPPSIPRKSKTPQNTSIESAASKLPNDKTCDDARKENEMIAPNTEMTSQSSSSPMYSIGSPNVSISTIGQDDGLISYTPDEEIPRLHISSDEENTDESNTKQSKIDDSDLLVKELKERGIYLIPNKEKRTEQPIKEKQSEETNTLEKEDNEEKKSTEQLKPIISPPIKEKTDKIEIMSDIRLDKSEAIDLSKIELSQSVITDVISGATSKNTEPIQEIVQENISINESTQENIATNKDVSKENISNTDSTLDVSEGSDYDFHVKVINEESPEYFNVTYDESIKTKKNISDYNFTVLERNISAKIFIEELDKWEDKTFTVTPYIEIYSISPKRKTKVPPTDNNSNTAKVTKTTESNKNKKLAKPSEPISKKGDSSKSETKSKTILKPLDILYNECADESSTDTIITMKEPEPKVKSNNSSNENDKKEKQTTKDNVASNKSSVKRTISLEQYKMNKNKTVQKTKDEINTEHVEAVELSVDDEDLMNFALTATSKDTSSQELNTKKRKAAEESMKQNIEKRMKPNDKHALLKSIDVDSFLTKVHGPSEKS